MKSSNYNINVYLQSKGILAFSYKENTGNIIGSNERQKKRKLSSCLAVTYREIRIMKG